MSHPYWNDWYLSWGWFLYMNPITAFLVFVFLVAAAAWATSSICISGLHSSWSRW
jgi:hypothetical protein